MIKIKLNKEKNLDSALKKLKFKFEKRGVKRELLDRKEYTKPSVVRRDMLLRAKYKQANFDNYQDQ
ncbi:30S ribosomal protein S21 [bacterium]|nr:30S ribosomal protein S21 [bacterium]